MSRSTRKLPDATGLSLRCLHSTTRIRLFPRHTINFLCSTPGRRLYQQDSRRISFDWIARQSKYKNILVWSCVGLNTAIFLSWYAARNPPKDAPIQVRRDRFELFRSMSNNFLLTRDNIKEGRYWTTLTSGFSHTDFQHLLFNMIAFQQLSKVLVGTPLSVGTMATLILGSCAAGSVTWLVHESAVSQGSQTRRAALGFSGAVMGVTAAVACLRPFDKVLLMGVIPMPLWMLGVGYAVYDTYYMGKDSRTAHDAHLGGAAFGGLFYLLVLRRYGGILGLRR